MFSSSVQLSILSLFSSTSSDPLSLFTSSTDNDLPSDSFIHLLHDRLSTPLPESPRNLLHLPTVRDEGEESDSLESRNLGTELEQTVLHIQSPTIRTTYIQSPAIGNSSSGSDSPSFELGLRHPWMHIQVRNLGRDWSFEVGISDQRRRIGVIRLSTFQKEPDLKFNHAKPGSNPLLLLPLSFPANSSNPLTPWSTISIHFPSLLPYFSSPSFRSPAVDVRAANGDDTDPHILHGRSQAPSPASTLLQHQAGNSLMYPTYVSTQIAAFEGYGSLRKVRAKRFLGSSSFMRLTDFGVPHWKDPFRSENPILSGGWSGQLPAARWIASFEAG